MKEFCFELFYTKAHPPVIKSFSAENAYDAWKAMSEWLLGFVDAGDYGKLIRVELRYESQPVE